MAKDLSRRALKIREKLLEVFGEPTRIIHPYLE